MSEDITPYKTNSPAPIIAQESFNTIGKALGKVKLKLTRQQFGSIAMLLQISVSKARPKGLFELAALQEAYKLAEKFRLKLMHNPEKVKLSLNMSEAAALYDVIDTTEFAEFAQYEANLALFVISEIDKQTV